MILTVIGKIFRIEHQANWYSFNINIHGGIIKVLVQSDEKLPYAEGDEIMALAKWSRLENGRLKMFTTPGLISFSHSTSEA